MKLVNLCIAGLFLFLSCNQSDSNRHEKKIVKDYFNRVIKIPEKVQRVIPLYHVQAEIICAIGASEKIVGIGKINENSSLFLKTHFSDILKIPQVGQSNINYEKILYLKPDIVFTGTEKPTIEKLEQLGCVAIETYPNSLKDIKDEIVFYGDILERKHNSDEIYKFFEDIENRISEVTNKIPTHRKPKIYYIRTDALTSLGGNVQGEIFSLAGGILVTDGIGDNASSIQMSFEDIYKYSPDVIIIRDRASIKPEDIYSDERWRNINAVKNKNIFQEHSGWTEFRLETYFGIIEKAKWLHPELFKDLNAEIEYEKFINIVRQHN